MARTRWWRTAVVVGAAALGGACGPVNHLDAVGVHEARANVPRADAGGVDPAPGRDAIAALGVDLYRRAATRPGNQALSPYSVAVALAMTRNGARGETRSQMDAALRAGTGDGLDRALNRIDSELARRAGSRTYQDRTGEVAVASANQLFGQAGLPFEDAFLQALAGPYGAGMRLVDYRAATEAARTEINAWAGERTAGKIVDLLPPGSLDQDSRLVLANALYLKAPWEAPLVPAGDQRFTRADGSTVRAPAMTADDAVVRTGPGWRSAELPYLGRELAMTLILPDDLARYEATLDPATLAAAFTGSARSAGRVQLPRFEFRATSRLRDDLTGLGMPLAFDRDRADFSGITSAERLFVDDVHHQAFLHVDEQGTEAAASTGVVMAKVSAGAGQTLIIDRPFLFAIRDVPTGAVLFLGRVADPTAP
jgi:serpin B